MEAREKPTNDVGDISRLTPATIAMSIRPDEIAACAAANATSDDEQAVSMVKLGPRRSKMYEMRLDRMDRVLPVMKWLSTAAGSVVCRLP